MVSYPFATGFDIPVNFDRKPSKLTYDTQRLIGWTINLVEKDYPITSNAFTKKLYTANYVRCSTEYWNIDLINWFDGRIDMVTTEQRALVFILSLV